MVRSLALCQPTPQHWSLSREVSSVLPLNRRSMQTKQRGNVKLDRWVCANLSDSTMHMESVQLILGPPERLVMSGSNATNACIRKPTWWILLWHFFSGRDDTTDVVWGRPFSIREANSSWVEWLHCSCSPMCSCSDKHRVLSHGRWLSNRVQHCEDSHEECAINDGTPYPELQCHYVWHFHLYKGQGDPMETTTRVWMGGFHIVMNYLAVLGKTYQSPGTEDLSI